MNIAVKVSYMIGDGNTLLNLNDSWFNKTVPVDTNSTKIDRLMLNYSETTNRIKVHQSTDWGVSTDMHGNPFNGFPSREVYVVCELERVTGDAGVKIYSLNGQSLSASDTDDFRPRIYTNGTIGECLLGDVVTLYPASYYDVLDPNLDATCAVYGPDGNPVVASDGTVLDENCSTDREYTFTVTEYGVYSVEYVCRDSSRNKQEYSYVFEVVDNIAPTVTFVSPKTSASVGSTVTVAKTEITDNLDPAENITVKYFVKAPQSFIITEIDASGTFKAESRGVYTAFCYAFDSMRNTTIVSYDIEVK